MKNKLTDLNDHLFAQLERLGDDELTDEQLKQEIARSKAIAAVATNVVNNARVVLAAQVHADGGALPRGEQLPDMLQAPRKKPLE